jgi:hypothetical protein
LGPPHLFERGAFALGSLAISRPELAPDLSEPAQSGAAHIEADKP